MPFFVRFREPSRRGFTLLEVLIALFVLVTGIGACLILMVHCLWAQELGGDLFTAGRHAAIVYERIQACDSWQDVTALDADTIIRKIDGRRLKDERIRIEQLTRNGPLADGVVIVSWRHRSRPMSHRLWFRMYFPQREKSPAAEARR